jgi:hypothetical protein
MKAELVYGLAVVDALNATHLMIQVIWWWRARIELVAVMRLLHSHDR